MTQSRKHAPHLDADLARDAEEYLRGEHTSRAEEWRLSESSLDDEPDIAEIPRPDDVGRNPVELTPAELEARSRFGAYVSRTKFPAHRKDLLRDAKSAGAPDDILADLERLPADRAFETPARAWAALGHPSDRRF